LEKESGYNAGEKRLRERVIITNLSLIKGGGENGTG